MSGNRKRSGGGGILDQLDPRARRPKPASGFSIGIEPRWVWAGGGAIVLLVAALASIAWSTTTTANAMPAGGQLAQGGLAPGEKPQFEAGPAQVERVALAAHRLAPILLARVEPPPMPPPMPLVVLPREASAKSAAKVVREPSSRQPGSAAPARARSVSAGKAPAARQAARKPVPRPQRAKAEPAPAAAQDTDPDVALIRAIRKATQSPSQ